MVTDPLQRRMFRLPGVDPAQVAASIYPAPLPIKPVAGQPLQPLLIKDLVTQARLVLNNPNADPDQVADLTAQLKEKGLPPEALKVAAKPLITGEKAVSNWYKPFVAEEAAEYTGPVEKEFVEPERGDMRYHEPEARDIGTLKEAATAAVQETVETGEVPTKDADVAKNQGQKALAAVLDADKSLAAQITAVTTGGVLEGATSKNYNDKAKELLGLDKSEADIPEWAAPIFLFGLNLMKAPVSTATRDTGLGGLLADIGKAGEVGFASFATERARKRKERLAVGRMAFDLKKSDDATRIAGFKANLESKRWFATYKLAQAKESRLVGAEVRQEGAEARQEREAQSRALDRKSTFFAAQFDKVLNRYTKDQNAERIGAFSAVFNDLVAGIGKNEDGAQRIEAMFRNPTALNFIGALAAKTAGLAPEFATKVFKFGRDSELTYATAALENYARKTKQLPGAVLTKIVNDPNNEKWAGIAIATNMGKNQVKMTLPKAEGVVTPTWINVADQEEEYAAAKAGNRDINPAAFTKTDTPYLEINQDMKRIALGKDETGAEKWAFVNFSKLALINAKRRKENKPELDMLDIIKSPSKAPGVVSPKYSDTSGALNNISTVEINTGPYETQDFLFNKNILVTKKKEIAEKLGIKLDDVANLVASGQKIPWEDLVTVGVFVPLGKPRTHKKPITKTIYGKDGAWRTVTGSRDELLGMENAANRAALDNQLLHVMQANRQSHITENILEELGGGATGVVSKWSEILGKVVAGGKLLGFKSGSINKLRDFDLAAGSTAADRKRTLAMISNWEGSFNKWADKAEYSQVNRQRLKTLFIDMAFNFASAREKGKLTDKDVDWAFRTLGFDADAYLQNPAVILAGLKEAMTTVNTGMEFRLMGIHESGPEIRKWNKENPNNPRYILEEVIKAKWSGVDPGRAKGFHTSPEGTKIYRYDKVPLRDTLGSAPRPGTTAPPAVGEAQRDTSIVFIPDNLRKGHIFGNLHSKQITNVPANLQTVWQDLKNQIGTVGTSQQTRAWAKSYVDKRIQELVKAGGGVSEVARNRYQNEAAQLLIFLDGIK